MVKKQLIMDKALELFAEQGFEATSVQQITDRCGISKGAFYLSFKSKEELIFALIDSFMMQFVAGIVQSVKECSQMEDKLYNFYNHILSAFLKSTTQAKIFLQEQSLSLNEELFRKLKYYDNQVNEIIYKLIEEIYPSLPKERKYELIIYIKSFTKIFPEICLQDQVPIDLKKLTFSMVEKTNIIAEHSKESFVTEEMIQAISFKNENVDDQIHTLLDEKIIELDSPIEKESLELLKHNLLSEHPSPALTKGLLENLKDNPHCKWLTYLIRNHYNI